MKFCMRIAVGVYFRKIKINGLDKIPQDVPIVFTPNHPSAFMDPILLAVALKQNAYFIARGESFQNKLSAFLLSSLRIIPIYRPDKTKHLIHKNRGIFYKCAQILSRNGSIIIFPEGLSRTELLLRKIHTGAARMAFSSENAFDFNLNVHVVPVGLNYSNPHKFRSDAILNIGDPIPIKSFRELYHSHPQKAVKQLTENISKQLLRDFTVADSADKARLAEKLITALNFGMESPVTCSSADFYNTNNNIVNWVNDQNEGTLIKTELMVNEYLSITKRYGIRRHSIDLDLSHLNDHKQSIAWVLFPISVLLNFLPYWISGWATDSIIKRSDFRGSFLLTIGFWIFFFYYLISFGIAAYFLGTMIATVGIVTAILTGFLSLPALDAFRIWKRKRRWAKIKSEDRDLYESLRDKQHGIFKSIFQRNQVLS